MLYGVRRVPLSVALKGLTIVRAVDYQVPNAEAGLAWARRLAEQKTKYDYAGALGLGLAPDRNWQDESNFFCFELFAGILDRAGRMIFSQNAHITGSMLLSIKP